MPTSALAGALAGWAAQRLGPPGRKPPSGRARGFGPMAEQPSMWEPVRPGDYSSGPRLRGPNRGHLDQDMAREAPEQGDANVIGEEWWEQQRRPMEEI